MTMHAAPAWPVKTLADLGARVTSGSRGWASFYSDHGDLFVRITNLDRDNIRIDLTNPRFVRIDPLNSEAVRTQLAPGDLLISITADIGIIGYVDESVPSPAYINQHIARVRLDPKQADSRFVAYYLSSWEPQRRFVGSTDTGAKAGMNLPTVAALTTVVPPVPEQKQIAAVLADVDNQIAALERVITKKQAVKQGLMQQLVNAETRLPGFNKPWQTATIGELCAMRGGTPKKRAVGGRYWVVDMGSVTRDADLVVTRKSNDASGLLRPGELVMPKDDIGGGNIIGRTGLIEHPNTYVLADHVYALTPRGVDSAFLNYAINGHRVNASLRSQATGSAQLGLSRRSVLDQEVVYPSDMDEQRAIAEVLTDAVREIAGLRARLTKARGIRVGMAQELLTGRTRLSVEVA